MPLTYPWAVGLSRFAGIGVLAGRMNCPVHELSPSAGRLMQTGKGKMPWRKLASGTLTVVAEEKRRSRRNSCEKKKWSFSLACSYPNGPRTFFGWTIGGPVYLPMVQPKLL